MANLEIESLRSRLALTVASFAQHGGVHNTPPSLPGLLAHEMKTTPSKRGPGRYTVQCLWCGVQTTRQAAQKVIVDIDDTLAEQYFCKNGVCLNLGRTQHCDAMPTVSIVPTEEKSRNHPKLGDIESDLEVWEMYICYVILLIDSFACRYTSLPNVPTLEIWEQSVTMIQLQVLNSFKHHFESKRFIVS